MKKKSHPSLVSTLALSLLCVSHQEGDPMPEGLNCLRLRNTQKSTELRNHLFTTSCRCNKVMFHVAPTSRFLISHHNVGCISQGNRMIFGIGAFHWAFVRLISHYTDTDWFSIIFNNTQFLNSAEPDLYGACDGSIGEHLLLLNKTLVVLHLMSSSQNWNFSISSSSDDCSSIL